MNLVSIVILNWNGKKYLQRFLPKLVEYSDLPGAEIVIVDNGSVDDSVSYLEAHWPELRKVILQKNHGFSGGYNKGMEQLDSAYFLLLNSDIEVTPGWLEPLLDQMKKGDNVGACTPKIKDINKPSLFEYAGASGGYIDKYGYPFCRGRIFDYLEEDRGQYDDSTEVFWGTGACLLVRADLYKKLGGLDEQFFAHMEEIDLCWRLKRLGYKIHVVPGSTVFHVGGGTLERGDPLKTFLNFRNNLLLLYKNLPRHKKGRIIFMRMMLDGVSALRFLFQGAAKDFWAVIRAHVAYHKVKQSYRIQNNIQNNNVIVAGIYPGSIVADFFLRGKKRFQQLDQQFMRELEGQ